MLRNNVVWVLMFAGTGSIDGDGSVSREKRIPEFLLQLLDLSFKICDEGCLFLELSRLEKNHINKGRFSSGPWKNSTRA